MEHELKCWRVFFAAIRDGKKRFEVRRNDRQYSVGDTLLLREFNQYDSSYTGAEMRVCVTYLMADSVFCAPGFVIMSIDPAP